MIRFDICRIFGDVLLKGRSLGDILVHFGLDRSDNGLCFLQVGGHAGDGFPVLDDIGGVVILVFHVRLKIGMIRLELIPERVDLADGTLQCQSVLQDVDLHFLGKLLIRKNVLFVGRQVFFHC